MIQSQTMAAHSLHVPSGLPSPTLTNPDSRSFTDDMILPEKTRSYSPNPYVQRPPSPSSLLYSHSNQSAANIKLASAPLGSRGPSPQAKSPSVTSRSSSSTLRKISKMNSDSALASSPTLADPSPKQHGANWDAQRKQKNTASNSSGSVHSEDIENLKWPGFDSGATFDDSGVVLEEEEERQEDSPKIAHEEDDSDNERWLEDDGDDDPYSSAALSRRAEIILANAKKRLNVMEGNLRGARQSLVVSPTFNPLKMASELSQQLAAARERDRQLYAGKGPIPPRQRPYQSSPLSTGGSPAHSRVLSETSIPSPPTNLPRIYTNNKRSSSAMGVSSDPWSPTEGHSALRRSIRETKSYEVMRDNRGSGWGSERPSRTYSRNSQSPPNGLEPLLEEDTPDLRRSASTTSDLRSQMNDLKGRISSLKLRAQEESLRRRSMQSLRTPSPFTSAESWYSEAEAYKTASPITADAGIGFTTGPSPSRDELYGEEGSNSSTPRIGTFNTQRNKMTTPEQQTEDHKNRDQHSDHSGTVEEAPEEVPEYDEDETENTDNDFVSVDNGELEPNGSSIYEDAVYEMPVAERHEDRIDAFDYEHFFLHSAMGSFSQQSRRSSSGSADSVETTRPVTAIISPEELDSTPKRLSMHQRNPSVDSVSTVATFATAAEDQESDAGFDGLLEEFSQQIFAQHAAQSNGTQLLTADNSHSQTDGVQSYDRSSHSPGADLVGGLKTSKMYSILLESTTDERRLSLNEQEKQLIYGLASSLQQLVGNLQSTTGDMYERKEWSRRLDDARKILEGEQDDQPF